MIESEVQKGFKEIKVGGKQPLCPKCNSPLQGGQPQYLSNYWQWNDKTKKYERDEFNPDSDEPFCPVCRAEYRDSLYR